MEKNKTGKYLKYAIGEIILVVIGILLALQINTWNNEHIAKKQLKEIYKQIQKDLVIDTTQIGEMVSNYKEKDRRIQNILDKKIKTSFYDTISSLNYKDCSICGIESTNYFHIKTMRKGYNLLKDSGVISAISKDSLPDMIDVFYINAISRVESQLEIVANVVFGNLKDLEHYSWFSDWAGKKYNRDFLIFIFESKTYRNQLSRYRIYYKDNYLSTLIYYKERASLILDQIELELKK